MILVKEMPYQEKYSAVLKYTDLYENFLPQFVAVHLGEDAVDVLQEEWQKGIKRLPIIGSPEEEYQAAYGNWIWIARTGFRFVRARMGEEGMRKLEQTMLHALIQQNKGWSLVMLNLVRLVSPDQAFKMLADQLSYNLQWLTPYVVTESSPHKVVVEIERCKVLEYPETEDVCQVCQQVYPAWVVNQYMADMHFERSGYRCTCTVRPLGAA
jgi:hypothetical protein